jgi:hypothetical protein
MKVVERLIQEIYPGQSEALEDIDKRYNAIEASLGFPPKKRLWCISGPHHANTIIIEREWESMAAMEAAVEKTFGHPELQAPSEDANTIVKNSRWELYTPA